MRSTNNHHFYCSAAFKRYLCVFMPLAFSYSKVGMGSFTHITIVFVVSEVYTKARQPLASPHKHRLWRTKKWSLALSCPWFKCWPLDLQSTCWPTSQEHPCIYQFTRPWCKQLCQRQNGDREVVAAWNCAFDPLITHQKCSQLVVFIIKIKKRVDMSL